MTVWNRSLAQEMFGLQHSNFLRTERNRSRSSSVSRPRRRPEGGQGSIQKPDRFPEGPDRRRTTPFKNCPCLSNTIIEYSLKISPCEKTKMFLQQKKTRAVLLLQRSSGAEAKPTHTPLSQASPGMPASITVRFLLAKHRKQKNRGFFQESQRKDFSDTVYRNRCRLSSCNTDRNSL